MRDARALVVVGLVAAGLWLAAGCDDSSGGANEERDSAGDSTELGGDGDTTPGDLSDGEEDAPCPSGGAVCGALCCEPGEVCDASGTCVAGTCEGIECGDACCAAGEVCDGGACATACSTGGSPCGGLCCDAGEVCDTGALACAQPCSSGNAPCNGNCCAGDRVCESGQCRANCEAAARCGDRPESEVCCGAGEVCAEGSCAVDCGAQTRCGSGAAAICCAAGEVCEAGQCRTECAGTRCGTGEELCCTAAEACLFDLCIETHGACVDNFDCELDAYCETSSGQCIKAVDDPNQCIYVPPVGEFAPEVQWHWSGSATHPTYDQVMMTPSVGNLNDDNGDGLIDENDVPDVVFATFQGGAYNSAGVIRVVSGDDGRELAASLERPFSVSRNLALGDIDNDGVPEIIASSCSGCLPREVYALELVGDGAGGYTLAVTATATLATVDGNAGATASIADLEGNGTIEVVTEFGILEGADLSLRCAANWTFPVVSDLDENGVMDIVANGAIYDTQCAQQGNSAGGGYAAVADMIPETGVPGELVPEIVWVRPGYWNGTIELWDVTRQPTGEWAMSQVWATTIPLNAARIASIYGITCDPSSTHKACNTGGGPPTIADFDGDGRPEVSTAARWYYIVLENDGAMLWADATTKDFSSAVTGSSVFDFEGDGKAEVVYADEEFLRVYKGVGSGVDGDGDGFSDAEVLYSQPNPSGTLFEYPLIVDVDNDGNAEIVLAANNYAFPGVTGIRVFKDPLDNWVRTRRVWNQHTYHVTNIDEDMSVPSPERRNWSVPGLNNFRQNVQPGGLFNAPNLAIEAVAADDGGCPARRDIAVTVTNTGSLGVGPGVWVGVYAVGLAPPDDRALLGRVQLTDPVAPGASVTAVLAWDGSATLLPSGVMTTLSAPLQVEAVVDDPPSSPGENGEHNECVETDNTSMASLVEACPIN